MERLRWVLGGLRGLFGFSRKVSGAAAAGTFSFQVFLEVWPRLSHIDATHNCTKGLDGVHSLAIP